MQRPASESVTEMTQMVMPNDTNPRGTVFGGRVLEWIDVCGAMCASRHSRCQVVTAKLAEMSFLSPIKLGHFVILTATVASAGRTSMNVTVRVESEDPITGRRKPCSTAELTYVALDADGMPVEVPRLKVD
ncbi:MAG TPA: acyl-CoA thioesterase [Candidatus Xenobia bacterium]|jgi:acyl-CoA hydrolase